MKKFLFIFIACFFTASISNAQKIGYIDSNFILSKMPAYNKVQQEMDKYAEAWQKEVETLQQQVDKLKQDYKAEEVLLTEEMKKKRQAEIQKKETEMRDYQRKVFGYEGMMFKRRQAMQNSQSDNAVSDILMDQTGNISLIIK